MEIEDIFGVLKGAQEPDRWVMIGNHRDTWVNGAVDATTGLAGTQTFAVTVFTLTCILHSYPEFSTF